MRSESAASGAARPLRIAISALGGQGGGVLADWLVSVAELHGWVAQSTSVPGVAQRTGTTIYYVEMGPAPAAGGRRPVFALMPVPGDVDLVVAAELMEAGRTVVRGFVTPGRTVVVASSHRVYGITEKSAMGDGIADSNAVLSALRSRSRRLICFDMETLADSHKSVISSVLFGAIAACGALPFPKARYEAAIAASGVAVKSNLAGFAAGFEQAAESAPTTALAPAPTGPATALGRTLDARIRQQFPAHLHGLLQHGVRRMLDYQDDAYAHLYLDRLRQIHELDQRSGTRSDYALTAIVGRHLALWMSYEDTIRVADLKIRSKRFERVRTEVRATPGQIVHVAEFMHPRFQEVCETLPAGPGRWLAGSETARKWLAPAFRKGRHVQTAHLGGFLMLYFVAALRRWRRSTLRYAVEQARVADWLERIAQMVARPGGYAAAVEIAECQRLVKGYSDTHERGVRNYGTVMNATDAFVHRSDLADIIRRLRAAALADDEGHRLRAELASVECSGDVQSFRTIVDAESNRP